MSLQNIQYLEAIKIINEIPTKGSRPLELLASDNNIYYAKTTNPRPPCVEVINEVICGYLAKCWGLGVPPFAIIQINSNVANEYVNENGAFSKLYEKMPFNDRLFFGSYKIEYQVEVEEFFQGINHHKQLKQFTNPLDFLKIGVFDLWVGNKDRKPDNPNILLEIDDNSNFGFCPIDHTASFAYVNDYLQVKDSILSIEPKNCILSHDFVKSIIKFIPATVLAELSNDILSGMNIAIKNLDFIFEQVPITWGFSKRAKAHLKVFFSDQSRNSKIAKAHLNFI